MKARKIRNESKKILHSKPHKTEASSTADAHSVASNSRKNKEKYTRNMKNFFIESNKKLMLK